MAILVTGGAGYIGSHTVLELLDHGESVVVLDDLSTGYANSLPAHVPLIVGDCGNISFVEELIFQYNIQEIIHFAAKILVPESVSDPLKYYFHNYVKSCHLLTAAIQSQVRHFIFSSTAAVYGESGAQPLDETIPCQPLNPYGRSKLMVEWTLEDAAQAHPLNYVILRYFNVAGADVLGRTGPKTPDPSHLIRVAAQAALGLRSSMEIFGIDYPTKDGSCIRDFIQVNDLARAHYQALIHIRKGGENLTCNCGYGHGFSVLDVIHTLKELTRSDFPVVIGPRRVGDPFHVVAQTRRIQEILGWQPLYDDLPLILQQALSWEKKLHKQQTPHLLSALHEMHL